MNLQTKPLLIDGTIIKSINTELLMDKIH
jgi:hypothetical protein